MKDKRKAAAMLAAGWLLPLNARAEAACTSGGTVLALGILVSAAIAAGGVFLHRQILPFLQRVVLGREAQTAVQWAEAVFGSGHGMEKWEAAVAKMAEYGWNTEHAEITDALKAAWEMLDIAQTAAGVKKAGEADEGKAVCRSERTGNAASEPEGELGKTDSGEKAAEV